MPFVRTFPLLLVLVALLVPGPGLAAGGDDSIKAFIERVNRESNALLTSPSATGCRRLLRWAFDVPAMGRYALGQGWDKATSTQRKEFLAAFEDVIVSAYLRRMKSYRGAKMTLVGVRPGSGSSRTAASRVSGGNVDQTWIWRMRSSGSSWRITDVLIDGRSALYAEKQDYAEILEANKGDVGAVIAFIRRRT